MRTHTCMATYAWCGLLHPLRCGRPPCPTRRLRRHLYTIFRHGQAIDRSQILYYRALRTDHCLKLAAAGQPMPEGNICARVGQSWHARAVWCVQCGARVAKNQWHAASQEAVYAFDGVRAALTPLL